MLNKDRERFVTASQASRVMAGFELELAGRNMEKPDVDAEMFEYISKANTKPLVGDLKKIGISATGAEVNAAWSYVRATTLVFSDGMESVAREIAMTYFIESRDESYKSLDMERGQEQEGEAINALVNHAGINFTAIDDGQKFLTNGNLGATPDGVEYDGFEIRSCAEVKNPKDTTHMKYLLMVHDEKTLLNVEPSYYWQAQCGLHVTGAKTYHWASYHNGFIENCRLVYVSIQRNDEHIDMLIERSERVMKRAGEIKYYICKMLEI